MNGNPDPVDNSGGDYSNSCPLCGREVARVPDHIRSDH